MPTIVQPNNNDKQPTSVDLAQACAKQASRRDGLPHEFDPCYELFCRAFASPSDQEAWQAILDQYRKLVWFWLGQYAGDDTLQEVFFRFWRAQENAEESFTTRFPDIKSVMGYLKRCAVSERFRVARKRQKSEKLLERLGDQTQIELASVWTGRKAQPDSDLKARLLSKLKDEREQVIFEGTYDCDLRPREIQAARPDLFPDVQVVYRVKENLLKRLRRDKGLEEWWTDGGNSTSR